MNTMLLTILIGFLYGTYDLFIKLSAGKIQPALGSLLCQIFSACFAGIILFFQLKNTTVPKQLWTLPGIGAIAGAGITIGSALILTMMLLINPTIKAAIFIPTILLLRVITIILWGIILLKEPVKIINIIGMIISLIGLYLMKGM